MDRADSFVDRIRRADRVALVWRALTALVAAAGVAVLVAMVVGLGLEWSDFEGETLSGEGGVLLMLIVFIFVVPAFIAALALVLSFVSLRLGAWVSLLLPLGTLFWVTMYAQAPGGWNLGQVLTACVAVGYAALTIAILVRPRPGPKPGLSNPVSAPRVEQPPLVAAGPVVFPEAPPYRDG
ncbi:MAG: hypothetical protein AAF567_04270 [Actinomycetota bacterium]